MPSRLAVPYLSQDTINLYTNRYPNATKPYTSVYSVSLKVLKHVSIFGMNLI